jgi:hypothetical protein
VVSRDNPFNPPLPYYVIPWINGRETRNSYVYPGQCEKHCPETLPSRKCFRRTDEIPSWELGHDYPSLECLVCLNIEATLYADGHYEVGNSKRETQDMIDGIVFASNEAGVPP